MATIEIRMNGAKSNTTMAVGEIFTDPRGNGPPLVNDVNVHLSRASRCHLPPGDYVYLFHVDGDGGQFDLEIVGTGNPANPTRHVDTSFGFAGWSFDFTVV